MLLPARFTSEGGWHRLMSQVSRLREKGEEAELTKLTTIEW